MEYLNAVLPVVVLGIVLLGAFFAVVAARMCRKTEDAAARSRLSRRLDHIESEQRMIKQRLDGACTSATPGKPNT